MRQQCDRPNSCFPSKIALSDSVDAALAGFSPNQLRLQLLGGNSGELQSEKQHVSDPASKEVIVIEATVGGLRAGANKLRQMQGIVAQLVRLSQTKYVVVVSVIMPILN